MMSVSPPPPSRPRSSSAPLLPSSDPSPSQKDLSSRVGQAALPAFFLPPEDLDISMLNARATVDLNMPSADKTNKVAFGVWARPENMDSKGVVCGEPTLMLSLGEEKARCPVEIEDKKRSGKAREAFTKLKDLLGEQHPIDFNITHHYINVYNDNGVVRYDLSEETDISRLLEENDMPHDEATVKEVKKTLEALKGQLLTLTKKERGPAGTQTWQADGLSSIHGPDMMKSGLGAVDRVLSEKDHRIKFIQDAMSDPKLGLVTKKGKKQILTAAGVRAVQRMKEGSVIRKAIIKQLGVEQNDLKMRMIHKDVTSEKKKELQGEHKEIEQVLEKLNKASAMGIDWTIMYLESNVTCTNPNTGASETKLGKEWVQHEDSRYLRQVADQSGSRLEALIRTNKGEEATSRVEALVGSKREGRLTRQESAAAYMAAGLLYHINPLKDSSKGLPLRIDRLTYHKDHGAPLPKSPTAEAFLLNSAMQAGGGKKEHFPLGSLGGNLSVTGGGFKTVPDAQLPPVGPIKYKPQIDAADFEAVAAAPLLEDEALGPLLKDEALVRRSFEEMVRSVMNEVKNNPLCQVDSEAPLKDVFK